MGFNGPTLLDVTMGSERPKTTCSGTLQYVGVTQAKMLGHIVIVSTSDNIN